MGVAKSSPVPMENLLYRLAFLLIPFYPDSVPKDLIYFLEALAPTSSTAKPEGYEGVMSSVPLHAQRPSQHRTLRLTRGQALPQLLGLLSILEDESVQVSGTPDLELGHGLSLGSGGLGLLGETGSGGDRGGVKEGLLDLGGWHG
jgi:hypothetical protein